MVRVQLKEKLFKCLLKEKPRVIYRQPVNEPLQTGIKAVDAMIPIGREQEN